MSSPLPPEQDPAQVSSYSPEQWQTILRNAQIKLRSNPRDEHAWGAVQDASNALRNSEAYPQHGEIAPESKFNSPGLTPESMSEGASDFFKNLAVGAGGEVAAVPLAAGARFLAPYAKESLAPIAGLGKPIANAARSASNKLLPNIVKENLLPSGVTSWLKGTAAKAPDAGADMLSTMRASSAAARSAAESAPDIPYSEGRPQPGQMGSQMRGRLNPQDALETPTFMRRAQPSVARPSMEPHDPEINPSTFDALKSAAEKADQSGAQSPVSPELTKFSSEAEPSVLSKALERSHQLQQAGKHGEAAQVLEEALQQVTEAPKPSVFPKEGLNDMARMQKAFERMPPEQLARQALKWIQDGTDQQNPTLFKNLLDQIARTGGGEVGSMPSDLVRQ